MKKIANFSLFYKLTKFCVCCIKTLETSHHKKELKKGEKTMIKGVNKQVLEINETQNGFFEKAIFLTVLPVDSAAQIRARCATDFDGGA